MKTFATHYLKRTWGTVIPNLTINGVPAPYPVVNDRAVRAGAGILFALGFFAFFQAVYVEEFLYIKGLVLFILVDFFIKVVIDPRYSPVSMVASYIVRRQTPEYVGAIQKRFAWSIGLMLAVTMTVLMYGFGIIGLPNLIICGVCLTFMFMESTFGICVGCKMYSFLLTNKLMSAPEHKPACPGNVCSIE